MCAPHVTRRYTRHAGPSDPPPPTFAERKAFITARASQSRTDAHQSVCVCRCTPQKLSQAAPPSFSNGLEIEAGWVGGLRVAAMRCAKVGQTGYQQCLCCCEKLAKIQSCKSHPSFRCLELELMQSHTTTHARARMEVNVIFLQHFGSARWNTLWPPRCGNHCRA